MSDIMLIMLNSILDSEYAFMESFYFYILLLHVLMTSSEEYHLCPNTYKLIDTIHDQLIFWNTCWLKLFDTLSYTQKSSYSYKAKKGGWKENFKVWFIFFYGPRQRYKKRACLVSNTFKDSVGYFYRVFTCKATGWE